MKLDSALYEKHKMNAFVRTTGANEYDFLRLLLSAEMLD